MPQPDGIEREQTRFDSGKEKGNDPAECDQEPDHGSSPLSLSQSVHTVFSRSNSSIRGRLTRRTVIFKRRVSNYVPTSGKQTSWLNTYPPMVWIPVTSISNVDLSLKSS